MAEQLCSPCLDHELTCSGIINGIAGPAVLGAHQTSFWATACRHLNPAVTAATMVTGIGLRSHLCMIHHPIQGLVWANLTAQLQRPSVHVAMCRPHCSFEGPALHPHAADWSLRWHPSCGEQATAWHQSCTSSKCDLHGPGMTALVIPNHVCRRVWCRTCKWAWAMLGWAASILAMASLLVSVSTSCNSNSLQPACLTTVMYTRTCA